MTTFSQLVDKMVSELKRPDLQTEIATYVNQTIRELHSEPKNGGALFFDSNLQEVQITADVDTALVWDIPKVSTFQQLKAARYDSLTCPTPGYNPPWGERHFDGYVYATIRKPGRGMNEHPHYCYRIQNSYVFHGYGGTSATISLAWYEYCPLLTYYPASAAFPNDPAQGPGIRPAQYDEVLGWTIDAPWNDSPADQATAQALTTNWMLLRWPQVIEEGVRAKVYKRVSDTERARTAFSMYTTLRMGMYTAEVGDLEGGY